MGGKGRLTTDMIDHMVVFYKKAIREANTIDEMIDLIMMSFHHLTSSDTNSNHDLCPAGKDSFCFIKRYEAEVDKAFEKYVNDHKNMGTGNKFYGKESRAKLLTKDEFLITGKCKSYSVASKPPSHDKMMLAVKFEKGTEEYNLLETEYKDLCDRKLLERCMRKLTQNPNESFHFRMWGYCPKVIPLTLPIMEFAIAQSVLQYHKGYIKGHIHEALKIPLTEDMLFIWKEQEKQRVRIKGAKKARKKRKFPVRKDNMMFEYEAGAFPRQVSEQTLTASKAARGTKKDSSASRGRTAREIPQHAPVSRARGGKRGKSASRGRGASITLWDQSVLRGPRGRRSKRGRN